MSGPAGTTSDLPTSPPNDRLFRYVPLNTPEREEWARQILVDHKTYFPSPRRFNDPFDCKVPPIELIPLRQRERFVRDKARELMPGLPRSSRVKRARQLSKSEEAKAFTRFLQQNVDASGVLCLCEANDDILMWSHYANGHTGICVEFLAGSKMEVFGGALPVSYSAEYPAFPIDGSSGKQARAVLLTKSSHWSYEREWRIIQTGYALNEKNPIIMGDRTYPFPARALIGVVFGCQTSEDHKTKIRDWAIEGGSPIKFSEAKRKKHSYGLDIESVD